MAAEASSGTNQRLTLDHSSFEKLLAAAWVLQCLQDQLHRPRVERYETIAEPVESKREVGSQREMETPGSDLQAPAGPVLQFSLRMTQASVEHEQLSVQPAENETRAEPVETSRPVAGRPLNFDVVVKIEPESAQFKSSLPSPDMAEAHPVNPSLAGVASKINDSYNEWARRRTAFNLQAANLRTALSRALDAFASRLPTFRINFKLRALRAVGIATPVWLLSLIAALLFLEVWRQGSFQSAQAISRPDSVSMAAVSNPTPTPATPTPATSTPTTSTPTTSTPPVSADTSSKRADKKPRWSGALTPLEVSHKRVTDPDTFSAVQQLSRYEIKGLRRQAKYGDESAAFTLGMAYEVGQFVPQNCVEAAKWVATAAEAGDSAAQYNLGLRYRDGDGVATDRTLSNKWLRKAAALRNRQARQALRMLASR